MRDRELPRDCSSATFVMGGCSCSLSRCLLERVLINNVIPSCRGIWMVKDSRRATLIRSRVN